MDASYTRQPFTFGAVANGTVATTASLELLPGGVATGPYTIVEAAVYDAPTTQSGAAATITVTAGPTVTVTGLTGMTAAFVGSPLTISGSSQSTNNGNFIIASFISSSSVTITNPAAVTDTGSDTWSVGNELYFGELSTPKTLNVGDTLSIGSGNFSVTES